jgi:hypothetical protein
MGTEAVDRKRPWTAGSSAGGSLPADVTRSGRSPCRLLPAGVERTWRIRPPTPALGADLSALLDLVVGIVHIADPI